MTGATLFSGILCPEVAMPWVDWKFCAEVDPFACSVIKERAPGLPNLGDVTADDFIDRARSFGPIDLLVGGSPCFPVGTLVLSERGLLPIEDITVEDRVLTHEGRYRRVLRTGGKESAPILKLKGQGHSGLEVTPEHPFYASSYQRTWFKRDENGKQHPKRTFSSPSWIEAKDMTGKFWASPGVFPALEIPDVPDLHITDQFWWMIGAFLGKGWTRSGQRHGRPEGQENGTIVICTGAKKADEMERQLKATGFHWGRSQERTVVRFMMSSLSLWRWIDAQFGKYADGKRMPAWLLGLSKSQRQLVFDGYAFTGGHRNSEGTISFSTVSRNLAVGIRLLSQSLGRATTECFIKNSRQKCVIEGRTVNESPYYQIRSYTKSRSSVEIGNHWFGLVRSVQAIPERKRVFNLEVEDDNSYTADGIIVHNCQSFSVAGLRKSLNDDRGNLTLRFVEIVNAINPRFVLWENVPGIFSSDGNPFGCLLSGLVGADAPLLPTEQCGGRWTDAGVAAGPLRTASWKIIDAQYAGVPQRRRRVFVLAGRAGDRPHPGAVLFVAQSLQGDSAKGEEARQDVTGTIASRTRGGGGLGTDFECEGGLVASTGDVSHCLNAGGMHRIDYETETLVTHSLRGEGFDGSEDGAGLGTPLVPIAFCAQVQSGSGWAPMSCPTSENLALTLDATRSQSVCIPILEAGARTGKSTDDIRAGIGIGEPGDPMFTLQAGKQHAIAFDTTQITSHTNRSNPQPGDPCHPISASGHAPAIAFNLRGREDGAQAEVSDVATAYSLGSHSGSADAVTSNRSHSSGGPSGMGISADVSHSLRAGRTQSIAASSAVRRLLPVECERLMGLPDGWTLVNHRGKLAADGGRYRAIGNGMAVPVMREIGECLRQCVELVDAKESEAAA